MKSNTENKRKRKIRIEELYIPYVSLFTKLGVLDEETIDEIVKIIRDRDTMRNAIKGFDRRLDWYDRHCIEEHTGEEAILEQNIHADFSQEFGDYLN